MTQPLGCFKRVSTGTIRKGEKTAADGIRGFPQKPPSRVWASSRMRSSLSSLVVCAALLLGGCSPLRGYKFATHGPGDTSAGDLSHASEPGARVVIPKKPPKAPANGPFYISSFDKPHPDCVEIDHKLDTQIRTWACATK